MKKRYKIVSVLHSGRKGLRNEPVDDPKYDGLVGCVIECNTLMENLRQFDCVDWDFVGKDAPYAYWHTSNVVQLSRDRQDNIYWLETINTIYELEEVKTDGDTTETGFDEG